MTGLEIGPNLLAAILALISLVGAAIAIYRQQAIAAHLEAHSQNLAVTTDRVERLERTVDKENGKAG